MGAGTEKYSEIYWHNAQYLPFYVVNGDRVGKLLDTTHLQFERWIGQRFPALWVQYKGRGAEWFEGRTTCVLLGNLGDVFGGVRVFPDARPDDGLLELGDTGPEGRELRRLVILVPGAARLALEARHRFLVYRFSAIRGASRLKNHSPRPNMPKMIPSGMRSQTAPPAVVAASCTG